MMQDKAKTIVGLVVAAWVMLWVMHTTHYDQFNHGAMVIVCLLGLTVKRRWLQTHGD